MVKFSANLGFLWADIPLPAAILAAKSAGFDAVECHWPYDTAATEIVKALDDTGLAMLGINTFKGDDEGGGFGLSAVPGQQAAARLAIDQAIFFAAQIGAEAVHVMAGKAAGAGAKTVFEANLAYACTKALNYDLTILIEPLNPYDAPGYFLNSLEQATNYRAVGSEKSKIDVRLLSCRTNRGGYHRPFARPISHHWPYPICLGAIATKTRSRQS